MKQMSMAILLPAILIVNGCCCNNCKQQDITPLPQKTEVSAQTEPKIETQILIESAVITELSDGSVILEEADEVYVNEAEVMTSSPLPVPVAAPAAEQTPPPTAQKPAISESHITDGRYMHPWAQNPIIKDGEAAYPAPWAYEDMQFGIHYTFIRAGTAYIQAEGITQTSYGPAYRIKTTANSAKVIDSVFKVRDINYSWIGVKDYNSYGYSQSIREGRYVRDEWITFDTAGKTYTGFLKKKGDPEALSGELPGAVQDMLTSLFYVRTQDLSQGKDFIFDVANREKTYPLIVKFVKKERVKVPAGTFDCVVVEPQFRGEGIFTQKGKSLKVWLTDDERKIPVKMETEVFIGHVSASLEKYSLRK
ncbi:hypothetical protein AAIR98_000962 [Elusimicrobium simillimum]|uniref:DUF3108 domain-containing protein n=1 Tax=Elusimicrobium simillimum TaxID=3143438 RepID=UPI003C6F306A